VPDGYTAVGVPARLIAPNSFSEPEGAKPVDIGKAK
jgi:serine acetyltransferase